MFIILFASCTPKRSSEDVAVVDTSSNGSSLGTDTSAVVPPEDLIILKTVFFDYNSFELGSAAREIISQNAREMQKYPSVKVFLEGHCDERGTSEYNLALGQKRADACRAYLVSYGIAPDRISTVSYGRERPAALGTGESIWAKNRRVEFRPSRQR
ncbi:peptidoglycan-associated lipoprotein Pal [candidate division WOR-3 bacterium]|nr:peptidoglycan-associated lipoprotein Pal [candidate division WOR-3 bacterium]